jgi:predicted ATPase/Tfp pilus assembly protein PilF
VTGLLRFCPDIRILATSREALGIGGEVAWHVPSLAMPDGRGTPALERLVQYEAVRLFIERATVVKQDFAVNNQNAPAVAQICYRLDGIPLAIELAAARVKVLAVDQILERLDRRLRLLTGGSRTAMPRQQTLAAAIDWSYDLLSPMEQRLFQALSVFAGGWTLDAAESVCADGEIDAYEVLDILARLVDTSLVEVGTGLDGSVARYRFLESIRQYSWEKLQGSDFGAELQGRHLDWCLALVERAEGELQGAGQLEWLERLESEHDNLRAALELKIGGELESALKLAGALWRFWYLRGYFREGRDRLAAILALTQEEVSQQEQAKVLNGAGVLAYAQGDYTTAQQFHKQSLELRRSLKDQRGIMDSLNNLGVIASDQGKYADAISLYEQCVDIAQTLGNENAISDFLNNLGTVAIEQGDFLLARSQLEEGLRIRRRQEDQRGVADILSNLAVVAQYEGNYSEAQQLLEESLATVRDLGDLASVADVLNNLGFLACIQENFEAAKKPFEESLDLRTQLENQAGIAESLKNLGMVAKEQQDYDVAKSLLEKSLNLYRVIALPLEVADILYELGTIASALEDREVARQFYRDGLAIFSIHQYQIGIEMCEQGLVSLE